MTFNEKLTRLRKSSGMSQEDLAEKLDVSRQAISKWEIGDSVPDCDKIIMLSGIFNVTTDYLLKDELQTPDAKVILCEKPDRTIFVSKLFQFFSTFFYFAGLLVSWIIWLNECGKRGAYASSAIGLMSIITGWLIQSIGIACYYVAKKLNKSNLKLRHVFLNAAIWTFIPLAAIYNLCTKQVFAPYPYNDMFYMLLGWLCYLIPVTVEGIILLIIYKKRKKDSESKKENI